MLVIETQGNGHFQVAFSGRALEALTEKSRIDEAPETTAEYGPCTVPASEVLRQLIAESLSLTREEAADDPTRDLDDGMPF